VGRNGTHKAITMHSYSYDTDNKQTILFWIAGISLLLVYLFATILIILKIQLWWFVQIPSALAVYLILVKRLEESLWKNAYIRRILGITIPDISGEYYGSAKTIKGEGGKEVRVRLFISQDWTRMVIRLEAENSVSKSNVASLLTDDGFPVLNYQYENKPKVDAKDGMHVHKGYAQIEFKDRNANGEYFTGRDRETYGKLDLVKDK
jgi:hypothetical protein